MRFEKYLGLPCALCSPATLHGREYVVCIASLIKRYNAVSDRSRAQLSFSNVCRGAQRILYIWVPSMFVALSVRPEVGLSLTFGCAHALPGSVLALQMLPWPRHELANRGYLSIRNLCALVQCHAAVRALLKSLTGSKCACRNREHTCQVRIDEAWCTNQDGLYASFCTSAYKHASMPFRSAVLLIGALLGASGSAAISGTCPRGCARPLHSAAQADMHAQCSMSRVAAGLCHREHDYSVHCSVHTCLRVSCHLTGSAWLRGALAHQGSCAQRLLAAAQRRCVCRGLGTAAGTSS